MQVQVDLANKLSKKFKIITVGEKIPNPDIKNFGYMKRKNLLKILKKTKFAFLSPENLLSLFALDSIVVIQIFSLIRIKIIKQII